MAGRSLVIGAHTEGIGDAVLELMHYDVGVFDRTAIHAPMMDALDVRSSTSIAMYIRENGPFDHIVYSAGVSHLQWVKDTTVFDLDRVFDINVFGAIKIAQSHLDFFPDHQVRYAVVVSDASDTPMRGSIAYCASKAALEMAVRVMARELAPKWITVAVSPGVVDDTGITNQLAKDIPEFRNWTADEARKYEDSGSVLGRRVTKEEVANTILFALTGPESLNGSTLTLNGGK